MPRASSWDLLLPRIQPHLTVAFFLLALATVRPLDGSPGGLVRLGLIVVTTALMLTPQLSDERIPPSWRLPIATFAAVTSGALMGLGGQGFPGSFGYMLAVHAGVRFAPVTALRVVAACAGCGIAAALVTPDQADLWWTNLLVVAACVPGITRRSRLQAFATANELVLATRRAAESEAAGRAMAERAEIARDIHDVLAHSLSGVTMQLALADALLEAGQDGQGRAAVRQARALAVTGLQEARAAVSTLRGDTVDVVQALRGIVTGPGAGFEVVGPARPLPARITHAVIRIAQEACTNARRHAPGAPLTATLTFSAASVDLAVRNAHTSTPSTGGGTGLGLVGMRERAHEIGAQLDARPLPYDDPECPRGWAVELRIPTPEPAEEDR